MGLLRDSNESRSSMNVSKNENRQDGGVNNTRQQDVETKREEFRKYLECAGIIDALSKVLVKLYEEPEKPDDGLEYICKYFNDLYENKSEVEDLRKELESAKTKIAELESQLEKCNLEETSA